MKKILITIIAVSLIAFFSVPVMASENNTGVIVPVVGVDNQGQGQGQGQSIDDHSTNTSKTEAPDRGFPVPMGVGYGPVINYYGKPLPGSQFRPVESLLQYANIFSEGALEEVLTKGKKADIIADLNVVREPNVQIRASYEKGEARYIKIIASQAHMADHGLIGYVTSEADDRKTDMMEVVAAAALEALREGADVLQIVAQGAARDTETSGWGIGLGTSVSAMLKGDESAMVAAGGTGYSAAWAGMRDKPWIQANALKSPTKVVGVVQSIPPFPKKAEVKPAPVAKKAETKTVAKTAEPKKDAEVWGTINGKKVKKVN